MSERVQQRKLHGCEHSHTYVVPGGTTATKERKARMNNLLGTLASANGQGMSNYSFREGAIVYQKPY